MTVLAELAESELILNRHQRIYHLDAEPEAIADTVILVGDPDRVPMVSRYFSDITHRRQHREFVLHTGSFKGERMTVLSTGIGCDNIDIVINELDALVNIDFETRKPKQKLRSLRLLRLGTCGSLQAQHAVGDLLLSKHAVGLDDAFHFYDGASVLNTALTSSVRSVCPHSIPCAQAYVADACPVLLRKMAHLGASVVTLTTCGFYAPQNRCLRAPLADTEWLDAFKAWSADGVHVGNFEMETALIYALGHLLGHRSLSISVVLANRMRGQFAKQPQVQIESMIATALEALAD
jgi:uridine phosphorylase